MINYFSFYRPVFMVQLLIAEFLFTCRLRKRRLFWVRYLAAAAVCILFATFVPMYPHTSMELGFIFMAMFLVTFIVNLFVFDVSVVNLLLCLSVAYTVQHFAYCMSNCLMLVTNLNANVYGVYTEQVMMEGVLPVDQTFGYILSFTLYYFSYWLFYLFFGRRVDKNGFSQLKNPSLLLLSIIAIVFSVFVNAFVVYGTVNGELIIAINLYNAICCVFIVYALFGTASKIKTRTELSAVHDILRKAEEQYKISCDVIDRINIKCHDMKQQIRVIIDKNAVNVNENAISEISETIALYESYIETGNKPLDVILTEKNGECGKNGITLSCVADGALLDFMTETEIYSMFGNALDNAIAAVMKLDGDKRCIGVNVAKVKGFTTVNVHNYFDGHIELTSAGLPKTSKSDKLNHGFGLKSIKYIVEKYGGSMSVEPQGDLFNLNILFPNKGQER